MKIAVFIPDGCPLSMQIYANHIIQHLTNKYGVEFQRFKRNEPIPENQVDLYWDPRCGGGIAPYRLLKKVRKPIVTTVHGLALFSLSLSDQFFGWKQKLKGLYYRRRYKMEWKWLKNNVKKVITVSEYSKQEVIKYLNFDEKDVRAIWNGYDANTFFPNKKTDITTPYFFNVTTYQKKKNFEGLLQAYQQLPEETRPDLVAVVKPYSKNPNIKGLKLITNKLPFEEIVSLYQNALALVFPSFHEGFGLPIIEAMACDVPVITSNITSCKEVAGDAALLVNPRNIQEIADAMRKIVDNEPLRDELIKRGKERVQNFSWEKTAEEHYQVFRGLIHH